MHNNAADLRATNNADGFDLAGGVTQRKLTVSGADIGLVGSGSNTYTFPSATDTLVGRASTDTLTNKTLTAATATTSFNPTTSDGAALGSTSLMWSDLFLASGSVINFNNGDVTLTHSSDTLTLAGGTLVANDVSLTSGSALRTRTSAGNTLLIQARDVDGAAYTTFITLTANNTPTCDLSASVTIGGDTIVSLTGSQTLTNKVLTAATATTSFNPTSSDGAALGSTSLMWSDLFLASGSVINFNNGDVTITHSTDTLTVAGGSVIMNDLSLTAGSALRTRTSAGNTLLFQARDVDGAAYVTFATLTANNTPTFDIQPTSLTVQGDHLVITTSNTPATAGATGTAGSIAWDSGFLYVCVATNTWKRVAIATW